MWLDALLAYLHFTAVFVVFSFLTVEVMLMRSPLDARTVRLLGRVDLWYFGSAIAALATGMARLVYGAKGPAFYLASWPFYVKMGLFLTVVVLSVTPTLRFVRWRRSLDHDAEWQVPEEEKRRMRRIVMIEVHVAALIPLMAVIMARGLGHLL